MATGAAFGPPDTRARPAIGPRITYHAGAAPWAAEALPAAMRLRALQSGRAQGSNRPGAQQG